MGPLVPLRKSQLIVGELVVVVLVHQPVVRAPGHAHEACAVGVSLVQSANAPRQRRVWWRDSGVNENSRDRVVDCHALVATDEVKVEAKHVRVEALEQQDGCVVFFAHHVVQVDWAKRDSGVGLLREACGACLGPPALRDFQRTCS